MDEAERKRQLLIELARARAAMSRAGSGVRDGLDFGSRVKASVRENPSWWIGGAVGGIGLILLIARVRRPKVVVAPRLKHSNETTVSDAAIAVAQPAAAAGVLGVLAMVARWVFPMVRPLIMSWVADKAAEWMGKKGDEPAK